MGKTDLSKIKLLVLDVDGVLTDGALMLTGDGDEIKTFNVRDGSGMKYWKRAGGKLAIVSGRGAPAVLRRAKELNVDAVRLNAKDKLPALEAILAELDVTADQTAVMGDDLTDVPMARRCALSIAPADAVEEYKQAASHVTKAVGGRGAVREAVEMILKATGKWQQILSRYFPQGGQEPGK